MNVFPARHRLFSLHAAAAVAFVALLAAPLRAAFQQKPASAPAAPSLEELHRHLAALAAEQNPAARSAMVTKMTGISATARDWIHAIESLPAPASNPGELRLEAPLWNGETKAKYEIFYYIPASYNPATPAPLILSWHGTAGEGRSMLYLWKQVADECGVIVASHTEPLAKSGYTFKPVERIAALSLVRHARSVFNIDPSRIFASGISRGGHLAWDTALRHPDLYAGIFPMIGGPWAVPAGGRNNLRYLPSILHLPIRDLQGAQDDPGLVHLLRYTFAKLKDLGAADAKYIEFPELGHSFTFGAVNWKNEISTLKRDSVPLRVTATSVKKNDSGRAFWLEITAVTPDIQEEPKLKLTRAEADAMPREDHARSEWWAAKAEKHTARLDGSMTSPGNFTIRGTGVSRFRILLTSAMYVAESPATVQFNGKTRTFKPVIDKKILLQDFADRLDRSFLPVAEIRFE